MEFRAPYVAIGAFVLAVIVAAFGFIYWIQHVGGLGQVTVYQVRFDQPVSGLATGSPVLFNGIRAGEVTDLRLDPNDPERVTVVISVKPATPVRADTKVDVDYQGITGIAAIALKGGEASAPRLSGQNGQPPLLVASAGTGESLTHAAREAIKEVRAILSDNAEPLHKTITGLSTFADMLGRNSERLEGVISGLERLTGGGGPKTPPAVYDLAAPSDFATIDKTVQSRVAVPDPTAVLVFDTQKILIRSPQGVYSNVENAQWADNLPKLMQAKIVQSFENAKLLALVSRPMDELSADYRLALEIRSFQIASGPQPTAVVEFAARLLTSKGGDDKGFGNFDKGFGDKTFGDKGFGDKGLGNKPAGDAGAADKPAGDAGAADKSAGDQTAGGKSAGDPPAAQNQAADKPADGKPDSDKPGQRQGRARCCAGGPGPHVQGDGPGQEHRNGGRGGGPQRGLRQERDRTRAVDRRPDLTPWPRLKCSGRGGRGLRICSAATVPFQLARRVPPLPPVPREATMSRHVLVGGVIVTLMAALATAGFGGSRAASPAAVFADRSPNAVPVDVELVLAVDVSYSMDPEEQALQREGYQLAITSKEFLDALREGVNGKVAVTYFEWAGNFDRRVVVPWRLIDGPESADAFAAEIGRSTFRRGSRTSISGALEFALPMFDSSGYRGLRRVIDVSGDGANNQGSLVTDARDKVLAAGISINGLPIMLKRARWSMMDVENLDEYYEDCVIGGPGAFVVPLRERGKFKDAIRRKLVLEIAGRMPEAKIMRVQARTPRIDCGIGERLWRERWGD
jgi:ABC-type uncharacterized transport system auxiliary subunit